MNFRAPKITLPFQLLLVLFLMASTVGCEEDVNPFLGTDLPFTVWGQINPRADTQAVRVFSIDPVLDLIPAQNLDATVTISELDTGTSYVLSDSLLSLPGNDFRHIYWGPFNVQHGMTYRLDVVRSDGISSQSEAITVPNPVELTRLPSEDQSLRDIRLPILITGNPPSLPRIDVTHFTFAVNSVGVNIADNTVQISYTGKAEETPEGTVINIALSEDFQVIQDDYALREIPNSQICSASIRVEVHVGNESWVSPVEVFDPNVLVEPGTLSNIENGFGYFAAGFIETLEWQINPIQLVRAGFFDCG